MEKFVSVTRTFPMTGSRPRIPKTVRFREASLALPRSRGLFSVTSMISRMRPDMVDKGRRLECSAREIEPVEHPIDDHAGDRDVEPERKRPAGDALMSLKASFEGARKSYQDQRHNRRSQDGMGDQDRESRRAGSRMDIGRQHQDQEDTKNQWGKRDQT